MGYYPNAQKKALIADTEAVSFQLQTLHGQVVYNGKLGKGKYWGKSGEWIKPADFSSFKTPGKYVLAIESNGETIKSYPFEIKAQLYYAALKSTLKTFYLIRASTPIEEKYAGRWKRKTGHPDTICYVHPSAEKSMATINSKGGWYDAGDYNKYIVNGGVAVGTLLNLYEMLPDLIGDNFSNIPESGNNRSDLLDEIKYELDWMLTMQASDGAAYFKLTSKKFADFIKPEEDTSKRFVVGKSTASTLNFAAIAAQAARIYINYDKSFAQKCMLAAEKAWDWAEQNPIQIYKNPEDIVTGEYSDSNLTEEFWWACSELYVSTQKEKYLKALNEMGTYMKMDIGASWCRFVGNLGSFSILLSNNVDKKLRNKLEKKLLKTAEELYKQSMGNPYRMALEEFQWGSNSDVLNICMLFAYAHKMSKDDKYLNAIIENTDYIFGKNPVGYSFVTGFGSKTPMHQHNRIIESDGVAAPIPGFVSNGTNQYREDDISKVEYGVHYTDTLPAKCYADVLRSYASNETCINVNAPAVFVLGYLEKAYSKD